jgi:D-glycero-D-manno-heptose 1,7-bisphosphate phosphatase
MLNKPDPSWTLFLDRDGVINRRPINDYVRDWEQFEFLPGVLEALKILAGIFGKVIIATNQQGIGKNLMSREDLQKVHHKMVKEIKKSGGRIDAIYFCPDLHTKPINCRKPNITMVKWAQRDHPEIDFLKSIMAGDTRSDMQFGQGAGMVTVYINTNNEEIEKGLSHMEFPDLLSFANYLSAID